MNGKKKFMCKLGFHKWNNWKYTDQKSCEQSRSCQYCSSSEKQILHDWHAVCSCTEHCTRCGQTQQILGPKTQQICECGTQNDGFMNC